MGIMEYSLLWVMQYFYHQAYRSFLLDRDDVRDNRTAALPERVVGLQGLQYGLGLNYKGLVHMWLETTP